MRRLRRVKIIATLGPASQDHQTIAALFDAGVDVFRINMSHGTHEDLYARVKMLRAIEKEKHRPIGILVDLQGPKLRVGAMPSVLIQTRRRVMRSVSICRIQRFSKLWRPAIRFSSMMARLRCM